MPPKRPANSLGASDIAVICGESPYKNGIFSLYERIISGRWDDSSSDSMEWGSLKEKIILKHYVERYGSLRTGVVYQHPEEPNFYASPDGVTLGKKNKPVDAKAISSHNAWKWRKDAPNDYVIQMHWQMYLLSLTIKKPVDSSILYAEIGGAPPEPFVVHFNKKLMKNILKIVNDFWGNNILPQKPPENDASDEYRRFLAHHLKMGEEKIYLEADDDTSALMMQYLTQKAYLAELQESVNYLTGELMKATGENYGILSKEWGSFTFGERKGTLKKKAAINELMKLNNMTQSEIDSYQERHNVIRLLAAKAGIRGKKFNEFIDKFTGDKTRVARFNKKKGIDLRTLNI